MTDKYGEILVYCEVPRILKELIWKAQDAGAEKVAVVIFGDQEPDLEDYGLWGADRLYTVADPVLQQYRSETYTDAFSMVIEKTQPAMVLVGATKQGLELSARVAERLDLACATWCVDFKIDGEQGLINADCMIYSGIGVNTYQMETGKALAAIPGGVFETAGKPVTQVELIEVGAEIRPFELSILEQKDKLASGTRLEDARVIVDVGQGFKEREDVDLAQELADLLGGQVSCSRPISSERDWFPEWVGLSGAKLSPDLCFTVGTSGAIQHMIGLRDSKIIVAVNNDEYAGAHYQADYGVVADLYEFLPALIDVLKQRSIRMVS